MRGQSGKTLVTSNNDWQFLGALTSTNNNNTKLCDVAFVVPTVRANVDMDPDSTLRASHKLLGRNRGTGTKKWAFDGRMAVGYGGRLYREVYMFDIPRYNQPISYANAALVTFNTTLTSGFSPASVKNCMTVLRTAPMLQRPQDVQRPEQPTGPESTGFVRWYVV